MQHVNGNDETVLNGFHVTSTVMQENVPKVVDEVKRIPNNFPAICKERSLDFKKVHADTGISQSVLYNLLNQTTLPQKSTLQRLATYLNVNTKEIFPNHKAISREATLAKFAISDKPKTHISKYAKKLAMEDKVATDKERQASLMEMESFVRDISAKVVGEKLKSTTQPVITHNANSVIDQILDEAKAKLATALCIENLEDIEISFSAKITGTR